MNNRTKTPYICCEDCHYEEIKNDLALSLRNARSDYFYRTILLYYEDAYLSGISLQSIYYAIPTLPYNSKNVFMEKYYCISLCIFYLSDNHGIYRYFAY